MDEQSIRQLLADLDDLNYQAYQASEKWDQKINDVISQAGIADQLNNLKADRDEELNTFQVQIEACTKIIKDSVITFGASVKGTKYHAIYTRGRETWDGKALNGYSAGHPEILAFRKVGAPSVSIREV